MNSIYPYKVFSIIAETGKFAVAAETLHLTPSAVSHMMANLEQDFGFELFIRSRDGVTLTEQGKKLLPYIRSVLREQDSLSQRVNLINASKEEVVRVCGFNSVTFRWLPEIYHAFKEKYPNVVLNYFEGRYADIANWIDSNAVDLAFVSNSMPKVVEYIPLYDDPIVCAVPPDMKVPECGYLTIDDLEDYPLIIQGKGDDADSQRLFNMLPSRMKKQYYEVVDDNCTLAMIEANMGIAFMGRLSCASTRANIKVVPFKPVMSRTIGLHVVNEKNMSTSTANMIKMIKEFCSAL